jgi:histidinol-phosphate aminotransferase
MPEVVEAVKKEAEILQLYPDPDSTVLRKALAERFEVDPDMIICNNGSDETLYFAFLAYCDGETPAVFPKLSYGFYPVFADITGINFREIPLKSDFSIDPEDYYDAGGTVFIANPNAPTGIPLSRDQIEGILQHNLGNVVVIDEAYVDFGAESCIPLTKKYKNLIVVMTYSKSRSLAGGRLGFAIADSELITDLNTIKYSTNPYNINRLTMVAGVAALEDSEYYKNCNRDTAQVREYTKKELARRGFTMTDSKANFIFAKSNKIGGEEYYLALKSKGVLVRHFKNEKIKDYVRITIGTKEQMDILLKTTDQILSEVNL